MLTYNLSAIASIKSGYTFREKIKNNPNGTLQVIQPNNLEQYVSKFKTEPDRISASESLSQWYLKTGDVLFLAKGCRMFAWVYDQFGLAIASNLFYVIRPDQTKVSPHYISFLLNNACNEGGKLYAHRQGIKVMAIGMEPVHKFQVKVPSLVEQNKFINLYRLWLIERQKTLELLAIREKYIMASMAETVESEIHAHDRNN